MICKGIAENSQSKEENAYSKIRQILSESVVSLPLHRISRENFQMTDEEAFLERISTFTSFKWSCKPKQISPPMCAKFGWKVAEKDLMQCTSCKRFLSAEIPPVWNVSRYLEAIRRLEESLKSSHHQFCPWQNSPSHDNFLHCKLLQHGKAVEDFELRLASLKEMSNCLPQLLQNHSNVSGFTENDCQQIYQLTLDLGDETIHNSVVLALTGWKIVKENISLQRISCDCCLRIVELSIYLSAEKEKDVLVDAKQSDSSELQQEDNNDTVHKSPKVKRLKKFVDRPFHPLEQHQSWCPWLQVVPQKISDSDVECPLPSWKMLLGIMRIYISQTSCASDKNVVPLRQGVLHVKKIVKDWIVMCSK